MSENRTARCVNLETETEVTSRLVPSASYYILDGKAATNGVEAQEDILDDKQRVITTTSSIMAASNAGLVTGKLALCQAPFKCQVGTYDCLLMVNCLRCPHHDYSHPSTRSSFASYASIIEAEVVVATFYGHRRHWGRTSMLDKGSAHLPAPPSGVGIWSDEREVALRGIR